MQNHKEFEKDLQHRSEEFWPHVYDHLTLDGSSQKGRIYGTRETQRRIAVESMIQAQGKTARKSEPPMLGNPDEGHTSLSLLEWVFAFVRDLEINSGFCLEYLMLPLLERPEDWEIQMPYWNAMNLMEREVLIRLQKATARIHLLHSSILRRWILQLMSFSRISLTCRWANRFSCIPVTKLRGMI